MWYIREVLRRGISLCNMPGASRVLANTGMALCGVQDEGSKQTCLYWILALVSCWRPSLACAGNCWDEHNSRTVSSCICTKSHIKCTPTYGHNEKCYVALVALPLLVSCHAYHFAFLCQGSRIIYEIRILVCGPDSTEKWKMKKIIRPQFLIPLSCCHKSCLQSSWSKSN